MGAVDEILPRSALEAIQVFLVMGGILAMVFLLAPWMIIPAILLGALFYYFEVIYVTGAQGVKRLEGVSKSFFFHNFICSNCMWKQCIITPITLNKSTSNSISARAPVFSHISASLYGLPTIRSCSAERMVVKEFDALQDQHTSTCCIMIVSSETFGFYLDIMSTIFLSFVTLQFLIFRDGKYLQTDINLYRKSS